MSSKVTHWGLFIASVLAAVVPQLLEVCDAWPKLKAVLGAVGVIAAAIVVQSSKLFPAGNVTTAPDIVDPPRTKDGGYTSISLMIISLVLAFVGGILLFAIIFSGRAHAAEPSPQFGGCVYQYQTCFGPSAAITVGQFNLATSKFSGGISPGIGYGATYKPDQWYATGLAAYLSFAVGGGAPNEAIPSLMLSFANYVRFGVGVSVTETDGPVKTQWRILGGFGSDFGGSPKYVSQAVAK